MFFRKGQVTILALLIGLMGLTIGLSMASRSLSDFHQVTIVDQGTKALAAAEAGLQYALNQLNYNNASQNCTPSSVASLPTNVVSSLANISGVNYNICFNTVNYQTMTNPRMKEGLPDLLICGNDEGAKRQVAGLVKEFGWAEPIDLGGIDNARWLEAYTALWVRLALKLGTWTLAAKFLKS